MSLVSSNGATTQGEGGSEASGGRKRVLSTSIPLYRLPESSPDVLHRFHPARRRKGATGLVSTPKVGADSRTNVRLAKGVRATQNSRSWQFGSFVVR